ncbi:hypothetical protein ARALYDRAFT_893717 [Arabidopsis lyrata subsp. lyrata]|uniref:Nucleoporin Nup133/Nup155-like C-terminal domain-containing protein n=1 Tax=Arabidopsis lyrata subsp. lyrata TaxID=81972 RepID=D7KYC3_ARALL|nr:hypothetical protein ARALYDRAFT_893717 [Arabidopsis lyrata subsp. lyrata]
MIFVADVLPTPDTASPMLSLYSQVLGKSDVEYSGAEILLASTRTVVELVFNRPVDILNTLLKSSSTCSRVSLNAFVDHFGADETAAMCLMLASGIIMFGGDEFDSLVPTRAAMVFGDMKMERMPQLGGSQAAIHSAAHAGLYLCTARLLYPLWNTHVMSTRSSSDSMSEGGELICRFSADAMHELESRIRSLERCLLRRSDAEDSAGQRLPNKHDNISKEDTHSMECCRHLIQRSAEALFLLQILSRHDIAISSQMFEESLLHLEFRHLVISGDDDKIAKVLISALMEDCSVNICPNLVRLLSSIFCWRWLAFRPAIPAYISGFGWLLVRQFPLIPAGSGVN